MAIRSFDTLSEQQKLALAQSSGQGMRSDTAILVHLLPDDQLLTVSEMAGTLFSRGSEKHREMINRLNSFLRYRQVAPDAENGAKAWYGSTVKEYLDPRYHYTANLKLRLLNGLRQAAVHASENDTSEVARAVESESETSSPSRQRWKFRFTRKLAALGSAAALFTAFTVAAVVQPSFYEVLRLDGWRAAVEQREARKRPITVDQPKAYYEDIWAAYRSQEYPKAERMTYRLLSSVGEDDPKLRADCFYALAGIKMETGFFPQALGFFTEAERFYQEADKPANLFWNAIGMAQINLYLDNPEEAGFHLDQAEWYNEQAGLSESKAHLLYNRMLLATISNRYSDALQYGMQALDLLENSKNNDYLANTYSEIGFIYALMGELAKSQEYTLRAQKLITRLQDEEKHVFNSLNYIVMDRARGLEPYLYIMEEVNQWIRESNQQKLTVFLRWAMTLEIGDDVSID